MTTIVAQSKMVRLRTSLLSLAISSYHQWALDGTVKPEDFRRASELSGVARIAFLRHGNTAPAANGIDFDRLLTDNGREQANAAGLSFGVKLKPLYHKCLVSPAPRTIETADIFLKASDTKASVHLEPVQSLYDETMQPEGSLLFKKLGYAPLRDYVDAIDDEDRQVAQRVLGRYSSSVVGTIYDEMCRDSGPHMSGTTLLVVGHAIYLPAASLGAAITVGGSAQGLKLFLDTNTREAEGYLIDIEPKRVYPLTRPEEN